MGIRDMLEYDYIVSPGANYKRIKWSVEGAEMLYIDQNGELVIRTPLGEIREQAPVAFQDGDKVKANWVLNGNVVSFKIGPYDRSRALRIDPLVVVRQWGTYFGGTNVEQWIKMGKDNSFNTLLIGNTASTSSIATIGAHQSTLMGVDDAFIAKFNHAGTLQWATYYGGNSQDRLYDVDSDDSSNVYVIGETSSTSAIASSGVHQDTLGGMKDAFLAKFSSSGTLLWGTYFGGALTDRGISCSSGSGAAIYIAGQTDSPTSIATPGSHQSTGGSGKIFLAKFTGGGSQVWGTYYGGTGNNYCEIVTEGSTGIYLGGSTSASNAIATTGSHQDTLYGFWDGFMVKFNANGVRQWGTYYGGQASETVYEIKEKNGNVYMCGSTGSIDGIATTGAHKTTFGGVTDAFVAKFNSSGSRQWGTYFGSTGFEILYSCDVDDSLNVYVAGHTNSTSGISTAGAYQEYNNGGQYDAILAKFDKTGKLSWATYYGGQARERGEECAVDDSGFVYLAGQTTSLSSIASSNGHQSTKGGTVDAYLVKFGECYETLDSVSISVCNSYTSPSGKYVWSSAGTYLDTLTNEGGCDSILAIDLTIKPGPSITSTIGGHVCDSGIVYSLSYSHTW